MEEWILRSTINNNWIFYVCFFNLLIIALLYRTFPKKVIHLANFLYIDKNVKTPLYRHFVIEPFNIGSFTIITNSLSLFFYKFFTEIFDSSLNLFDFFYILFIITITLTLRFFLVKYIFSAFSVTNNVESYLIKNQSQNTLLCVSILVLILIKEYSFININLILILLTTVFLIWIRFSFLLIYRYIKKRENEFLYIIFYLCAIKISPWLWIYHSIYETRIKLL